MLKETLNYFNPEKTFEGEGWETKFFNYLLAKYGNKAPEKFADVLLSLRRIQPEFVTTTENRKRLMSESGIIFANHPRGVVDAAIVLKALQDPQGKMKEKLMFMVLEESYETFKQFIDEKTLVPATREPKKLIGVLNLVLEHINAGGSFFIFPESWENRNTQGSEKMVFEGALTYLISRLPKEKMVYSLSINPKQVNKQPEKLKPWKKNGVTVLEHYSITEEWQKQIEGITQGREKTQKLAKHFLEIHKDNLK